MDYGMSIRMSVKEQLLANIVGLRYLDAPLFVDISSVINQYALSGRVSAGVGFNNSLTGGDTGSLGASGRWEDRPTITYTPISGRKFSESLLTPIPPEALFALVQSGWPSDLMFRLTVSAMNGVEDSNGRMQAEPNFRELLQVWARLRDVRAIGLRRTDQGEGVSPRIVVYVNEEIADEQTLQDIEFLRSTLNLDPDADEYTLVYGLVADSPGEIAVLTDSILDIMLDMSWEIDVPQEHVDSGRTRATFIDTGMGGPLFRVHSSEDKPEDVYVAVQNRGYWFYIDDRDMISKRTFGVLQILLSLTDAGESARGPVVSIGG